MSRSGLGIVSLLLALAGGEALDGGFQLGREPVCEPFLGLLGCSGELLPPGPAALRAEVVERDGARDLAEPGARRAAPRVEPVPEAQRALERLAGQVLGREAVSGEPGEIAVDVVEVRLGRLREARHTSYTPPWPGHVTPSVPGPPDADASRGQSPGLVCVVRV